MHGRWHVLALGLVALGLYLALDRLDVPSVHADDEAPPEGPPRAPQVAEGETRTIGGRVVHSDGRPAVGAEVTAQRQGGEETVATTTGANGAFLLDGLEPGFHRVRSAVGEQLAAESWASTGVHDLRLTLAQASDALRVRVLGPDRGAVPRFDARLLLPTGYQELDTQTAGSLTVGGGDEQWAGGLLEIWNARNADGTGLGYSPVRIGPLARDQSELAVRMYTGSTLEGVVLGPEGPLAESLDVELGPLERWWETRWDDDLVDGGLVSSSTALPQRLPYEGLTSRVGTDDSGRFRIAFLRPGVVHELAVDAPDGFVWVPRREVREGDGPLEIHLQSPMQVRVTVLGPDRTPLKGVYVNALRPGSNGFGSEITSRTNADGVALLGGEEDGPFRIPQPWGGLDPTRKYKLVVNPNYGPGIIRDEWMRMWGEKPEHRSPPYLAEKALDDWLPTDTTVHLERGYTVSGRVLDTKDRPLAGRQVGLCTPVGYGHYETRGDGRFAYHGVPAGTVYLALDDGGDFGGIVDRLRERMWEASFGPRERYSPESPPPVRAWTQLEVTGDLTDVTLRVPATTSVELVLPPGSVVADPGSDDFSPRDFDATRVAILHLTEKGWKYFRTVNPALGFFPDPESEEETGPLASTVHGLMPGDTYAAWMPPVEGEYVYVEFPADVGKLQLERKKGATIRGRILNRPRDSSRVRIHVFDDRKRGVPPHTPDWEGGFQVRGLPDSMWTVHAWCRAADDVVWEAEAKVKTGHDVELRLVPRPEKEDE